MVLAKYFYIKTTCILHQICITCKKEAESSQALMSVWVYLAEGKPLKFGLLVTAARFALTDPKINTALSLSLSMSSLRPASSGYSYLLLLHSTDFDEATPLGIIGHKPRAHRLLFSATTCAQSLQFVPSGPLSTPHPVCCPERWSELITSKDCYVLCLPVGFGQWEALAGDNKKGGKWVGDIYLSGSLSLSTQVHCSSQGALSLWLSSFKFW